jgi:hypothetical protein
MRQRPRVFEDLAKVPTIDPPSASRALNEVLSLVRGLLADMLADDFAASNTHAADISGKQRAE